MLKTVSIIVTGKVQGVYYRQSTKEKARELNITGEVYNLSDGSVKIVATGMGEQIEQLIQWCRVGPRRAIVDKIEVTEMLLQSFHGFDITRH